MTKVTVLLFATVLGCGAAFAQATTPPPVNAPLLPNAAASAPATQGTAAPAAAAGDKQARSKECSAEADQKGLHGKARKAFRSKCRAGKA